MTDKKSNIPAGIQLSIIDAIKEQEKLFLELETKASFLNEQIRKLNIQINIFIQNIEEDFYTLTPICLEDLIDEAYELQYNLKNLVKGINRSSLV